MSAIDYLAEAKVKSEAATHISHTDPQVLAVIAEGQLHAAIAQAEATAALVEQQRITNLIAVGMTEHDVFFTPTVANPYTPIFAAIREGLGIA